MKRTTESGARVLESLQYRYAPYSEDEWFTLSTSLSYGKSWTNTHYQVGDCERAAGEAQRASDKGLNVYSTLCVFDTAPAGRGTKNDISRLAWLFVDLDAHDGTDPKPLLERLYAFRLRPTLIIASGRGYHAYWRLEPALVQSEIAEAEDRLRWLRHELRADPTGVDASHSMRVPFTRNSLL